IKVVDRSRTLILIVYDSFREHLEESAKQKFYDCGFDLAVIPGGLISLCQPLDVAINKPFKNNLRKEWHLWMAAVGISTKIIIDSFKTCGISNMVNDIGDSDKEIEGDLDISNLENNVSNFENDVSDDNLKDN
ncbi:1178_t:CDS:2, partial [Funneliformis geosporum]